MNFGDITNDSTLRRPGGRALFEKTGARARATPAARFLEARSTQVDVSGPRP